MLAAVFILLSLALVAGMIAMIVLVARDTARKSGNWGINTVTPDRCPHCGTPLPTIRVPKNLREMMWGGWTCEFCQRQVDKWGKLID